jgi:hypothetical protein
MLWIRLAGWDRDEADDILCEFGLEIRGPRDGGVVCPIELESWHATEIRDSRSS